MPDEAYILELKKEIAAFDDAAKWTLIDRVARLDDEVLEKAVNALGFPVPDKLTGSDYQTMTVPKKMEKNHLGEDERLGELVSGIIGSCMCHSRRIGTFIYERCRTEPSFAEMLRTYFCRLYANFRHAGLLGDDLFLAMTCHFRKVVGNESHAAAATAILVHLFLICDVFEKSGEPNEVRMRKEAMRDPSE